MLLKRTGILFCLLAFAFQAVLFNVFLFGFILSEKMNKDKYAEGTQTLTLTLKQYKNLQWLSRDEITLDNFLIDVKEVKKVGNKVTLICKIDIKEKDFTDSLIDYLKNTKNKKSAGFSSVYEVSGPSEVIFIAQVKTILHKNNSVSVFETLQGKSSPPPKA
jgi:hypothetical protein